MELTTILIITLIAGILAFVITSLPLYFAVKFLGGKTTIFKTVFINIIAGIVVSAVQYFFLVYGSIIAFIVLIWIYHEAFRLKWFKALLAWVLQLIFLVLLYTLAYLFLPAAGITLVSLL